MAVQIIRRKNNEILDIVYNVKTIKQSLDFVYLLDEYDDNLEIINLLDYDLRIVRW